MWRRQDMIRKVGRVCDEHEQRARACKCSATGSSLRLRRLVCHASKVFELASYGAIKTIKTINVNAKWVVLQSASRKARETHSLWNAKLNSPTRARGSSWHRSELIAQLHQQLGQSVAAASNGMKPPKKFAFD